jgi:hypothetical protein
MATTGSRLRKRYSKGKKVRGIHRETGEAGMWCKTQISRYLNVAEYKELVE